MSVEQMSKSFITFIPLLVLVPLCDEIYNYSVEAPGRGSLFASDKLQNSIPPTLRREFSIIRPSDPGLRVRRTRPNVGGRTHYRRRTRGRDRRRRRTDRSPNVDSPAHRGPPSADNGITHSPVLFSYSAESTCSFWHENSKAGQTQQHPARAGSKRPRAGS